MSSYQFRNRAPKGPPPSALSEEITSASSLPMPPVNNGCRQSPRSDIEKLDMVCNYMRNEFRWGVSDFVKTLASAGGSNNTRRKAAFAAAAYEDLEVLRSYYDDANQLWDGRRKSMIETLDLGNKELRKEVERLGVIMPFN